jgi:hypothetical protein
LIRYLTAGMKRAFGLHRPGRRLPVRREDILLASYPKSGNKWMQFLIANLRHPGVTVSFGNLHRLIIDPERSVKRDMDRAPQPRIVKSHGTFDPRYQRVIYIVRDPRDVALSQFEALRASNVAASLEDFVDSFLTGELNRYHGSWGENVGAWLAARSNSSGFLLIRYEDLLADNAHALSRVAEFMGWPASSGKIRAAVERCGSGESAKRDGRKSLPEGQISRIEAAWGDIMTCLGYELVTRSSRSQPDSTLIQCLTSAAFKGSVPQRIVIQ